MGHDGTAEIADLAWLKENCDEPQFGIGFFRYIFHGTWNRQVVFWFDTKNKTAGALLRESGDTVELEMSEVMKVDDVRKLVRMIGGAVNEKEPVR